jgi:tetratricopeptide (TPR) repeat protein
MLHLSRANRLNFAVLFVPAEISLPLVYLTAFCRLPLHHRGRRLQLQLKHVQGRIAKRMLPVRSLHCSLLSRRGSGFISAISPRREHLFNEALKIIDSDSDYMASDADRALELLDQSLHCAPEHPLCSNDENLRELSYIHYRKGLLLFEMGLFHESVAEFDTAISLDSQRDRPSRYVDLFHHKGLALSWLERYSDSLEALDTATEVDPANTTVWTDKGRLHLDQGNVKEAIKCFLTASELDPQNCQVLHERV